MSDNVNVRTYERKPNRRKAMLFNRDLASAVEKWCGGELRQEGKSSDPTDVYVELRVPNIKSIQTAKIGDYVILDEDGRFTVESANEFLSEYREMGVRTSDLLPYSRTGGETIVPKDPPLTPHYVPRGSFDRG